MINAAGMTSPLIVPVQKHAEGSTAFADGDLVMFNGACECRVPPALRINGPALLQLVEDDLNVLQQPHRDRRGIARVLLRNLPGVRFRMAFSTGRPQSGSFVSTTTTPVAPMKTAALPPPPFSMNRLSRSWPSATWREQ